MCPYILFLVSSFGIQPICPSKMFSIEKECRTYNVCFGELSIFHLGKHDKFVSIYRCIKSVNNIPSRENYDINHRITDSEIKNHIVESTSNPWEG